MRKELSKVIQGDPDNPIEKEITFYSPEDITEENAFHIASGWDSFIETGYCPVCGHMTMLNRSAFGYYAWCSVCGLEGPKHWHPYNAVKMFSDRTFTTVADMKKLSKKAVAEFNLSLFDEKNRQLVEEFIKEV